MREKRRDSGGGAGGGCLKVESDEKRIGLFAVALLRPPKPATRGNVVETASFFNWLNS